MRKLWWLSIALALWSQARAENFSGVFPEALKDINPVGAVCRGEAALPPGKSSVADGPVIKADLSCAISAEEAHTMLAKSDTVVVDIRAKTDFEQFRINGAMNLGLADIKTKSFLKTRALLLVGGGKGERQLYESCAELKSAGFNQVRVLRGGMLAWLVAKQPVVGQEPDVARMVFLSPEELFQETAFDANVTLVASVAGDAKKRIARGISIAEATTENIRAAMARRQRELKHDARSMPFATMVVVTSEYYERPRVTELLDAFKPAPILIYAEPISAYDQYLTTQKAVWDAQARGPKQPSCSL